MSFMQGDPLPDVTVTKTTDQETPDYYTDYLTDLSKAGETALDLTGAELFEPQTAMQTSGYSKVPTAAAAYSPLMGLAETAGKGFGGIDATDISAFFDPYQTGVLNELDRLSAQNVQRNLLPSLKAGFVGAGGAGGLGSQRYADALGQSLADVELGLAGQRAGLMSKGYQDAIANAFKQAQEERQAAAAQGDLATLAQELGLTEASALTKFGAEEQALGQAEIEAPLKTAMNVAQLMRGYQIPMDTTETEKGPKPGAYASSPFQDIGSILSVIGAYGGKAPGDANPLTLAGFGAKEITDFIKGINFNSSGTPIEGNQYYEIGVDAGSADLSNFDYY
jgi:hypothetical protein